MDTLRCDNLNVPHSINETNSDSRGAEMDQKKKKIIKKQKLQILFSSNKLALCVPPELSINRRLLWDDNGTLSVANRITFSGEEGGGERGKRVAHSWASL